MELLFFALPISLVVAAGFLAAFIWATRDDQFEDLDSPARRMLHDDVPLPPQARAGSTHLVPPTHTNERPGSESAKAQDLRPPATR
ncbi:MAG: cbb3-type cytochrome oxidase assembly protein CcoS [Phycisphaeraceae bacterium]|nr:cbb3-type cytochrome oxidase assembly protein CcoS [Phycisphaeraceae bacterium]